MHYQYYNVHTHSNLKRVTTIKSFTERWSPKHNTMLYESMHRSIQLLCGPALPGDVHGSPRPPLTVCSALIPTLKGGATGGLYIHVGVRSNPCILYPDVFVRSIVCSNEGSKFRFSHVFLCDYICV